MSELRYDPLLGEWLATATRRQDRTHLPPADFCPLCPTRGPDAFPTEVPEPDYDLVAFENLFPSLRIEPEVPAIAGDEFYKVRPAQGVCEVVLYSPKHGTTLAAEPVEQIYKLVKVWRHRFEELSQHEFVKYVFIFENKGEAVGVTLHHPHGQIYAYPFIPPVIQRELEQSRMHSEKTGHCLICDILVKEEDGAERIVASNEHFAAYIPFFARYPYEVHIASRSHRESLSDLDSTEERALAGILKQVLSAYDRLFDRPFPYIMVLHQAPSDGGDYGFYHFHIEFYPPMRSEKKLKYLAGSEVGAGMFINDTLPEEKAAELRSLVEPVRWR
jgi:UDPglucose--hexose-1-phosphate uridylyltransferase